jgi:DNA-binding HxlR family transcriptional regulator
MFAGSWVLQEWARRTGSPKWKPSGLRPLAAEGLLQRVGDPTRGGHRAYYRMPDRKGVEEALRELEVPELPPDAGSSVVN